MLCPKESAMPRPTARFSRPCVEWLETRTAPATITWTGSSSGPWEEPANWTDGNGMHVVPGPDDDVVINAPGRIISHSTTSAVKTLSFANGTLTGTGDTLTVQDLLAWTGGTLSGTGQTNAPGALAISGTTLKTLSQRTLNNGGTATDMGQGPGISFSNGATFNNLSGATFTYTGEGVSIGFSNGAMFNNRHGATFDARGTTSLAGGSGVRSTFNNEGTFLKSAGVITGFQNGLLFNNSGAVQVQSGTLDLSGGGTSGGSFRVEEGARLNFGEHTLVASSGVTGAGTVAFSPFFGTTTVAGTYDVSGHTEVIGDGATVHFTGTVVRVGQSLTVLGATANFDTGAAVPLNAVDFSSGSIGGSDTLTVGGLFTWTNGELIGSGRMRAQGGLALSDDGFRDLDNGYTLDNAGTATWTGTGRIGLLHGSTFNNLAGATFDVRNDLTFLFVGQAGTFQNAGTFRQSAGTGTTTFGAGGLFTSTGAVQLLSGALRLSATFPNAGSVAIGAGATLSESSDYNQTAGVTDLAGGTLTANGTVAIQGGALSGSGTINGNVQNAAVVRPGSATATGVLTINGAYTQTATGLLSIKLGGLVAGSQYDQLVVNGLAALDGTLSLALANGFPPQPGDQFQALMFGSASGAFAHYAGDASGFSFLYVYEDGDFLPPGLTLVAD
jgi:hypothetical protein